jgi:hypothetical protein
MIAWNDRGIVCDGPGDRGGAVAIARAVRGIAPCCFGHQWACDASLLMATDGEMRHPEDRDMPCSSSGISAGWRLYCRATSHYGSVPCMAAV